MPCPKIRHNSITYIVHSFQYRVNIFVKNISATGNILERIRLIQNSDYIVMLYKSKH